MFRDDAQSLSFLAVSVILRATPKARIAEQFVISSAALRGVGAYGVSPYFLKRPPRTGILLGYARMREQEIREGIRRLGAIV
jgi:GntR family transcriptional regulator / MocR family aminotransferase